MNQVQQRLIDCYNATEPLTAELALAASDEIGRLASQLETMNNEYWRVKRERDLLHRALRNTGMELNARKRDAGQI